MALKKVLTIAGSDTSAGAGMQADLKASQELDVYGMVALISIVITDKETWSHDVAPIDMNIFEKQLETAISIGLDAIKTGMLGMQDITKRVGDVFVESGVDYSVVDPVMVCKGEDEALNPGNTEAMIQYLLPKATVAIPNLFEAGQLSDLGRLTSIEGIKKAAQVIYNKGTPHVIIKGDKVPDQDKSYDLYYDGQQFYQLTTDMFQQSYNHGAGYIFAAATTACLANGKSPKEAIIAAKAFVASAIKNGWKMNNFVGPVDHGAYNRIEQINVEVTEI